MRDSRQADNPYPIRSTGSGFFSSVKSKLKKPLHLILYYKNTAPKRHGVFAGLCESQKLKPKTFQFQLLIHKPLLHFATMTFAYPYLSTVLKQV
jgi:hypothetical protein